MDESRFTELAIHFQTSGESPKHVGYFRVSCPVPDGRGVNEMAGIDVLADSSHGYTLLMSLITRATMEAESRGVAAHYDESMIDAAVNHFREWQKSEGKEKAA